MGFGKGTASAVPLEGPKKTRALAPEEIKAYSIIPNPDFPAEAEHRESHSCGPPWGGLLWGVSPTGQSCCE